ncbi:uncharacterized protein AB675_9602 [Cyphellophora attinorum]|uniref:Uncharacterized protein n=1 Tax=Cyphellophora attinorum TaxID=1664694 RepID=A0A0N1H7H8_9EURO|nr:uncharacterized protein AB675_9602 [Phialophora attinorum]KPI42464.1 hypothetical protein AB675_9602 [Phialophora attinorum]
MVELLFITYNGESNQQKVPKLSSRHTHAAKQYYEQRDRRQQATRQNRLRPLAPLQPHPTKHRLSAGGSGSTEDEESNPPGSSTCGRFQNAVASRHITSSPASSLAASIMDPFDTMSSMPASRDPLVQESLHFFVNNQLMEFCTEGTELAVHIAKKEVYSRAVWHSGISQICVYGGMLSRAYLTGVELSPKYHVLSLRYKQGSIEHVREAVKGRTAEEVPEETLAVMLRLAVHGSDMLPVDDRHRKAQQTYFHNAQNVDYYLRFQTGWDHLRAIFNIVDAKGGLPSLKVGVFVRALRVFDIFCGWRNLQAPHFPLTEPVSTYIVQRQHTEGPQSQELLKTLGTGFCPSEGSGLPYDSPNQDLHKHAAIVTADYAQVLRNQKRRPRDPKLRPDEVLLKFTRWMILHDILSIPDPGPAETLTDIELLQEANHQILLAYAFAVLVPIPPSQNTELAEMLTERILRVAAELIARSLDNSPLASAPPADLTLCVIIWAGVCAQFAACKDQVKNERLYESAAAYLRDFLHAQHSSVVRKTWKETSEVMRSYLWLDAICEVKGQEFWVFALKGQEGAVHLASPS